MKNRDEYLIELCKDKEVLHIGACDAPLENTIRRYISKELLFLKIEEVAKNQIGYDIDKEAIEFLKKQGYRNLVQKDFNEESKDKKHYDVILCCEVLEHLMNLKVAFDSLKNNMSKDTILVISTPNYLTSYKVIKALKGRETQHPDHNLLMSEMTLEQLLLKNNFKIKEKHYTFLNHHKNKLDRMVASFFPRFSSTLLFLCRKGEA